MALTACDECGRQISDKATHCVHCGIAISDPMAGMESQRTLESEEHISNKPLVGSLKRKSTGNFPTTLLLFNYITLLVALLHIVFTFFMETNMFPTAIVVTLYRNGMFIPQLLLSLLISIFIVAFSLLTLKTKNTILRMVSGIYYLALSIGSFQVFTEVSIYGLVWQWSLDGPRIPVAPFALTMVALQLLCVVLLFLPSSSAYFMKRSVSKN